MNIGQAATASGVSAKMIRYYESVSLLPPPPRTPAGYRSYGAIELHTLRFLARARSLGFPVARMKELLALWRDDHRSSADVKRLALAHVATLEAKARQLHEMSQALRHLAECCGGNDRPECPIIDELASDPPAPAAPPSPRSSRR